MYSRDETVSAVLKFYQQITRHPGLDDSALLLPPQAGWDSLVGVDGKDETVRDLLRHLPYLCPKDDPDKNLLVCNETNPAVYIDIPDRAPLDEAEFDRYEMAAGRLPAHCVYLTCGYDKFTVFLILDTRNGTITELSDNNSITIPSEEFDALPWQDRWTAYRSLPAVEFLDRWTRLYAGLVWMLVPNPVGEPALQRLYCRADNVAEQDEFYHRAKDGTEEDEVVWREVTEARHDSDNGGDDEDENRKARNADRKHVEVCLRDPSYLPAWHIFRAS